MKRVSMLAAILLLSGCAVPMASRTAPPRQAAAPVTVGVVAINDFHGALEPPKQAVFLPDGKGGLARLPSGGAAWLASAIDSVRGKYANHLTVSAGDLVGGSPLTSSLFLDEPAIEVMNRIGLDFNAVGNHEFDEGIDELRRKQAGGCARHTARKPCQIEPFRGARFPFLAANSVLKEGGTLFPATAIRHFGKGRGRVSVGLIGLTLKGTGGLSPPEVSKAITFADEADTANALVGDLKRQGADAVIVLIHQGGRTSGEPNPNGCEGLYADIRPILDRLDSRVDLVISGHTHWAYVCDYGAYNPQKPFLLTSAGLWGEMVTDITLEIDPVANRVIARRAHNIAVQSQPYRGGLGEYTVSPDYPAFEPRADIAAYVARYVAAASEFALRKAGTLAAPAEKTDGKLRNTGGALGALVADSQLAATAGAGAQVAFINPFGLRRSLIPASDGTVTFGDLYAVLPFNNELVTVTLTGAGIRAALEQGLDADGPEQLLTPSAGFTYSYDRSRPIGDRIVAMALNGVPIDPAQSYRVGLATFLADGGDTFTAFAAGRDRVRGVIDVAALEAWLKAVPPRVPPPETRATDLRPEFNATQSTTPPGMKY